MAERWKDIPGYEGLYQVSDMGRVKRMVSIKCKRERMKKLSKTTYGYDCLVLYKDSKGKTQYVHRLVLRAFYGPPGNGMITRHLDGNPGNNNLTNLTWGTKSENQQDSIKHGTKFVPYYRGSLHKNSKLNEQKVINIRKMLVSGRNGDKGPRYTQKEIAKIFGVSQSTISAIKVKRMWRNYE